MQFITLLIASLSAAVMATPLVERQGTVSAVCPNARPVAVCCAFNALNLIDLNCNAPATTPLTIATFRADCAARGQQAQCCRATVLGQGALCADPTVTATVALPTATAVVPA